jgi:hypothetical protein
MAEGMLQRSTARTSHMLIIARCHTSMGEACPKRQQWLRGSGCTM